MDALLQEIVVDKSFGSEDGKSRLGEDGKSFLFVDGKSWLEDGKSPSCFFGLRMASPFFVLRMASPLAEGRMASPLGHRQAGPGLKMASLQIGKHISVVWLS